MDSRSAWLDAAPLVIAHRGASAVAPENTLPAFEQAAALGAEAVELDAKRTLDGEVVAFHDRTLHRTTGGEGSVGSRSLRDLRRLDAGAWKSDAFRGTPIPTLGEVLETVGRRLLVNVELSDYWGVQARLVERVVEIVRAHRMTGRVLFSSFDSGALAVARQLAPEIPRGHLFGPTPLAYRDLLRRRVPVAALHPHESRVRRDRIEAAHRSGRRVHVYTVLQEERMRTFWAWGVDGLITDLPDVARRVRDEP